VNTVDHVVWRVPCSSADGDLFCPEHQREDLTPLRFVSLAGLHDCFPDVEVLRLYDSIGLGVVSRDSDVVDSVLFGEDISSSNVGSGVVGNNLFESSPAAEDILEDKVGNDFGGVRGGSTTFWIGGESISGMENITVGSNLRH